MSRLGFFKELFSRPRERHAWAAGFIFTYLGVFHQPLASYVGFNVMKFFAFGIGLMIVGVSAKAVRDLCNQAILPKKANIPDDIKNEWIYYWGGIFLVYFFVHVSRFVF